MPWRAVLEKMAVSSQLVGLLSRILKYTAKTIIEMRTLMASGDRILSVMKRSSFLGMMEAARRKTATSQRLGEATGLADI
jgi:hypothetical protein